MTTSEDLDAKKLTLMMFDWCDRSGSCLKPKFFLFFIDVTEEGNPRGHTESFWMPRNTRVDVVWPM